MRHVNFGCGTEHKEEINEVAEIMHGANGSASIYRGFGLNLTYFMVLTFQK